jgi:UDP-GlcNAc3NAcA epimerase
VLQKLALSAGDYLLCTLHRSENTDDEARLRALIAHVRSVAAGAPVVFPLHPRTRQVLERLAIATDGLKLIEPVGYFDMHALLAGARQVLTDSGGLQKEAYFHRVPCVTLRDETEWGETLAAGWNRLWTQPDYVLPRREIAEYGDGAAAEQMVALIKRYFASS